MRISENQRELIVKSIKSKDPGSEIFLFGSRVNDSLRGGDIDVLVISQKINLELLLDIRVELSESLEDFPFDIMLEPNWDNAFSKHIRNSCVKLD